MAPNHPTGPLNSLSQYSPLRTSDDSTSTNETPQFSSFSNGNSFEHDDTPSADTRHWRSFVAILDGFAHVPFIERNAGLLLVAISSLFFALMHTAVKVLNTLVPPGDEAATAPAPISALELVVIRMVLTYTCCTLYMIWKGISDPFLGPSGVRLLLVFRGFCGFFRVFGIYFSLQYLSLSDATVLTFLSPISTAIVGSILLDEVFSRKEAIAGVLSLLGVVLIARPQSIFGNSKDEGEPQTSLPSNISSIDIMESLDRADNATHSQRLLAVGAGLLGVMAATGVYVTIRTIGKRIHPLHSLSFFSSHCVLLGLIGMLITREPFIFPFHLTWITLFLLVTILGFLAQVFLTMGLQREAAGRGTLAIYLQIIFASIFEQALFHTIPTIFSILGTIIIIGSAIYIVLTKRVIQPRPRDGDEENRGELGASQDTSEEANETQLGPNSVRAVLLQHSDTSSPIEETTTDGK